MKSELDDKHLEKLKSLSLTDEEYRRMLEQLPPRKTCIADREIEIIFEGTLHTTPDLLLGMLRDFRLSRAKSLEGTAIEGIQFDPSPSDEYFSCIYIWRGDKNFGTIAHIDIRRLNHELIKVTIPSTKGDLNNLFPGEAWNRISSEIDIFLSNFGSYLQDTFEEVDQREVKEKATTMQTSTERAGMVHREETPMDEQPKAQQTAAGQDGDIQEPWEGKVPNDQDRTIIKNIRRGLPPSDAARSFGVEEKTIYNRESALRKKLGSDIVPFRQKWRQRQTKRKPPKIAI